VALDERELLLGLLSGGHRESDAQPARAPQKKQKGVSRTLQPLRTSMPSTCESGHGVSVVPGASAGGTRHVSNVVERLLSARNIDMLRGMVEFSLDSVQRDFFQDKPTAELDRMRASAAGAQQCVLLVLFFLLLNVNAGLKKHIFDLDTPANRPKLVRFVTDLRRVLVLDFFTDNSHSLQDFVDACEEAYVLA